MESGLSHRSDPPPPLPVPLPAHMSVPQPMVDHFRAFLWISFTGWKLEFWGLTMRPALRIRDFLSEEPNPEPNPELGPRDSPDDQVVFYLQFNDLLCVHGGTTGMQPGEWQTLELTTVHTRARGASFLAP